MAKLYAAEAADWLWLPRPFRHVLAWITILAFSTSFLSLLFVPLFFIPALWRACPVVMSMFLAAYIMSMLVPCQEWPIMRKVGQLWYEVFDFSCNLSPEEREVIINNGLTSQYIIGMHPHGIVPLHAVLWTAYCDQYFKNSRNALYGFGAAADAVQYVPFLRNFMGWLSGGSAAYKTLKKGLVEGKSPVVPHRTPRHLYILPGGIAEVFTSTPRKHTIIFSNRRGLIRLSLETGAQLVPTYVFGATDFFQNLNTSTNFLSTVSRKMRMGIAIFWGQFGLPIPYTPKVTMCIGKPIEVKKVSGKVSEEMIDDLHAKYILAMKDLFEQYKGAAGYPEGILEVNLFVGMALSAEVKRACLLCPFEIFLMEGSTTCPLIFDHKTQLSPSAELNHVTTTLPVDNSVLPETVSVLVKLREGFSFESFPQSVVHVAISSVTMSTSAIEWLHRGAIDISHSIMAVTLQPLANCDEICNIHVTFNLSQGQPQFIGHANTLRLLEQELQHLHSDKTPFITAMTFPIPNLSPAYTYTLLEKRLMLLLSPNIAAEKQLNEDNMLSICQWFYEKLTVEENVWSKELLDMLRQVCSMHQLTAMMPYFDPSHTATTMMYTDDTDVQRLVTVTGKEYIHPYGWYYNVTWSPHVVLDKLKFADGQQVTKANVTVGDRVTYKDKDIVEIVKVFHGTLDENNNPTVEVKIVRKTPHAKLQTCD